MFICWSFLWINSFHLAFNIFLIQILRMLVNPYRIQIWGIYLLRILIGVPRKWNLSHGNKYIKEENGEFGQVKKIEIHFPWFTFFMDFQRFQWFKATSWFIKILNNRLQSILNFLETIMDDSIIYMYYLCMYI